MKKYILLFLLLISFDKIYSAERIVLLEVFTSTTCPPCAQANTYFDNWLRTYQNANKVAVIKYHVWWPSPGNDPFYSQNKTENKNRNNFYGNNYAPHGYINGNNDGESVASTWVGKIENEISKSALLSININWKETGYLKGEATINVIVDNNVTLPDTSFVLQFAVIENEISYTGPNHDPIHHQVMKKMLPDENGEAFKISSGETKSFSRTIDFKDYWKKKDLQLVAFVQAKKTKEVLNAGKFTGTVLFAKKENSTPDKFSLEQNYPNPFNNETVINFSLPKNSFTSLKIYDVLGNEVEKLINKNLSTGNHQFYFNAGKLKSGIYFYVLDANGFQSSKKMILIK